ncbi:biotin--[acetyl-CoA-carboxylase] ligase [Pseudonocardia eucalypti]|uniref:biotin--[biotin carboxyl-carrier protein] ligase n=1 Tax=Pseudonocardia eucalypti TaxID=648755 RepID=A0ABP9PQK6_9PSEU|nr:BirA family biotin operon repressor/biotin-[acetyl-CoA-carboxylase] ligase [Pseudonocardia eucalypti]
MDATDELDITALRSALDGVVNRLDVVARTGSTNADLLAEARSGAPDRTVLVAELQESGRGRMDRRWDSPTGTGLTFSVLLRPAGVPPNRWGWLPLLAGVALVRTLRELTPVTAALKWPNDLLLGPADNARKGAGLLAEVATAGDHPALVLGIGLNVHTRAEDLPDTGTSLAAVGASVGRGELLVALLRRLLADEAEWRAAAGDPDATGLRAAYRSVCATLGSRVRLELPGGQSELAVARDVDADGRLVVLVERTGVTRAVAAGDVVHLRPAPSS